MPVWVLPFFLLCVYPEVELLGPVAVPSLSVHRAPTQVPAQAASLDVATSSAGGFQLLCISYQHLVPVFLFFFFYNSHPNEFCTMLFKLNISQRIFQESFFFKDCIQVFAMSGPLFNFSWLMALYFLLRSLVNAWSVSLYLVYTVDPW